MNHSPGHETVVAVLILSAVLPINQRLLQAQYQRSCSGESRPGAFAQYYLPQTGGTQTLTVDLPSSTRWSVTNPARISWITINSPVRGMGKGGFKVSLAPNASSSCRFDSLSILINNWQQLPLHIWQDGLPSVNPAGTVVNLPPIGTKANVKSPQGGVASQQVPAQSPSPPSVQELSTITIKSLPEGAEILVDGKFVGNTPSTLRLAPGDHSISIEKSGFESWKRAISLSPSGNITIDAELKRTN